jgi:hypothetical protein
MPRHPGVSALAAFALACLLLPATAVQAEPVPLDSFDDLMTALRSGHTVRVVADYGRCELIVDNEPDEAPDAVGGMVIDAWEWFAPGAVYNEQAFVVFSHASLIEHPRQGMVTNHVKFKVWADGQVVVSARYLDPVTYEETMFEKLFAALEPGGSGPIQFYRLD